MGREGGRRGKREEGDGEREEEEGREGGRAKNVTC